MNPVNRGRAVWQHIFNRCVQGTLPEIPEKGEIGIKIPPNRNVLLNNLLLNTAGGCFPECFSLPSSEAGQAGPGGLQSTSGAKLPMK